MPRSDANSQLKGNYGRAIRTRTLINDRLRGVCSIFFQLLFNIWLVQFICMKTLMTQTSLRSLVRNKIVLTSKLFDINFGQNLTIHGNHSLNATEAQRSFVYFHSIDLAKQHPQLCLSLSHPMISWIHLNSSDSLNLILRVPIFSSHNHRKIPMTVVL